MGSTHITYLIDRSGSMESQRDGVFKGFQEFIEEQRTVAGDCTLTLIFFDDVDVCEVITSRTDIHKLDPGLMEKFQPRGMTPLHDAIARAVFVTEIDLKKQVKKQVKTPAPADEDEALDQALEQMKNALPDNVIFVIVTDGLENASKEHNANTVGDLIKKKESEGWTFIYLGSKHNVQAQAYAMAVASGNTFSYAGDNQSYLTTNSVVSSGVKAMRSSLVYKGKSNKEFFKTAEEKKKDS